jgi:DNA-binding response OmpR family regulator
MKIILCNLGPVLSNALVYRLRKYGMQSHVARNPTEALHRIHTGGGEALVLGVGIKEYALDTFINLIREDINSALPIILVADTENLDMEIIIQALDVGANDFVTFPFKPAELVLRLQWHLHQKPSFGLPF